MTAILILILLSLYLQNVKTYQIGTFTYQLEIHVPGRCVCDKFLVVPFQTTQTWTPFITRRFK